MENAKIKRSVTSAAGRAILKFSRNLSCILQPCPWHAAMVVSDMNERLSPNIAPPMTLAMRKGASKPDADETATAIGVMSVMVRPTSPIETDTKQLTTNSTATAYSVGITDSRRYATLSTLSRPTTPTKMPAA